jgi:hypothetical protein
MADSIFGHQDSPISCGIENINPNQFRGASPYAMSEPLKHNARNPVTHTIERVAHGKGHAVRKVLSGVNGEDVPPEWRASHEFSHWNFWEREARLYQSEVGGWLEGSGARLARLHGVIEHGLSQIEMILEDISGRSGMSLTFADYVRACRAWGEAQARLAAQSWRASWTSREFLRTYASSKPVNYGLLYDDEAWSRPLIAENWPSGLREELTFLHENKDALFDLAESSERVPSHLDFWPNNIFVDDEDALVPIDWSFYGEGGLAEDIANFIPDAVFDGFVTADSLPRMEAELLPAYMEGLVAGGLDADPREVRQNLYACSVKYVWLGPLLLEKAGEGVQQEYGGRALADANDQYRNRGLALARLCEWAKQALAD